MALTFKVTSKLQEGIPRGNVLIYESSSLIQIVEIEGSTKEELERRAEITKDNFVAWKILEKASDNLIEHESEVKQALNLFITNSLKGDKDAQDIINYIKQIAEKSKNPSATNTQVSK